MRGRGSAKAGSVVAVALLTAIAGAGDVRADHPRAGAAQSTAPFAPEPALLPTPKADCGPGSRPETGIQGRVSPDDHASGRAAQGFTCNTELVGAYTQPNSMGTVGGFKVERYVDADGHDCAYYDTTLMFPTNLLDQEGGVNVMDMSDPASPTPTAQLLTPAMDTPHESLVVSTERGLLAAVAGNLTTNIGQIDIYDISNDCRQPQLRSSTPMGFLGHESGLSPDGRTFYSASPAGQTLVAVDISNPALPVPIWFGNYDSHGLSISADGNRAYVAGTGSGLTILDTTEIQERVFNPNVPEVARLQWNSMSIPQNAIPITVNDHPYLVEIDEFGAQEEVGAGRIIDIADERNPRVISNLRLGSSGRVTAVLSKRGRVVLVTTTARAHGNRGVRPGSSGRAFRRAYSRRAPVGNGLFLANRRSPRLIGVRNGRVRFFAVAGRSLLSNPSALRRHLRLAGL